MTLVTVSGFGQRPVQFGVSAVGVKSQVVPVTVTLPRGGHVDRIKVLTSGSEDLDFRLASDTCATSSTYLPHQSCTVSVVYQPTRPGKREGSILLLNSLGEPLAAQPLAAMATGPVANFISGQITTVAGNSAFLFSGDGGPATSASLFLPFGITLDGADNIYIADTYNERVRRVDHASGIIETIAGDGVAGFAGDGGPGTAAHLNQPSSVALDAAGNVYIADTANDVVRVLTAGTGIITTIAGTAGKAGYSGDGELAIQAKLQSPNGLALDGLGNLYIADTANNVVRGVNLSSGIITTFAGTGVAGYSGNGKLATAATLNAPWGLAFDASGNLDIADQNNDVIRQVNASGVISTIAGSGSPGYSGDTYQATLARLNKPSSITFDAAGNLYIADSGNNRIRKVNPVTKIITTIAGDNSTILQGDGYPATLSALYGPYGIALDGNADIFVADVFHNRIREVPSNIAILLYPTLRVNSVSDPLEQTIENDGTAPLNVSDITAISDGIIQPSTTCGSTNPLLPLSQCVVSAEFSSPTVGNPVTGSIQISSDGINAPNTLLLQTVVTSTSSSTVVLSSSPDPSILGNPVTFTVQVVPLSGVATGTLQLLDGATTISTLTLTNGMASTIISNLSVGQHTITAAYSGDANNSSATSLSLLQVVNPVPLNSSTTTSITTSSNPIAVGQTLAITAVVAPGTSGQTTPTGSVTFFDGINKLGSTTLNSGSAVLATSSLTAGTHCLMANYGGDSLYTSSSSACFNEFVTTTVNPPPSSEFTLTVNPATLSITRGSHAILQLGIAPVNSFSDALSFGCGGLPSYATCTFSQNPVAVTGGVSQTVNFIFDTAAPLGIGSSAIKERTSPLKPLIATSISFGMLCFVGCARKKGKWLRLLCMGLSIGSVVALGGCGSLSTSETPAGSYTIQVFASGAKTGASSYVNIPITVTQ